jgi:hypothetical protein
MPVPTMATDSMRRAFGPFAPFAIPEIKETVSQRG